MQGVSWGRATPSRRRHVNEAKKGQDLAEGEGEGEERRTVL